MGTTPLPSWHVERSVRQEVMLQQLKESGLLKRALQRELKKPPRIIKRRNDDKRRKGDARLEDALLFLSERQDGSRDAWLRTTLVPGWIVAYRLVAKNSLPVVAELRVFPDDRERGVRRPSQYHGDGSGWSGQLSAVPEGGLETIQVRKNVLCGEAVALTKQAMTEWRRHSAGDGSEPPAPLEGLSLEDVSVRRSDPALARLAARYVYECDGGNAQRACKAILEDPGFSFTDVQQVYDRLHRARNRKILSKTQPGRPGGVLLPFGHYLLGMEN